MTTKLNFGLSVFFGLYFLFSFITKVITITDWMDFNYTLIENKIGYLNAILILLIEGIFALQFFRRKISFELLGSTFLFVFLLTVFVFINKDLLESCMCFGTVIPVKPGVTFFVKNISLLLILTTHTYVFFKQIHIVSVRKIQLQINREEKKWKN